MPPKHSVKSDFLKWDKKTHHFALTGNPKEAVRFLRPLNKDYQKYDLRKPLHKNTIRKIEADLAQFFRLSERTNVQFVRPRSGNRKFYQDAAQQYGNWKVFAVPRETPDTKLRIRKLGKQRIIVQKSNNITYRKLYFNKKELAKDPEKEVKRLTAQAKQLKFIRIIVGEHRIAAEFLDVDLVINEIKKLMEMYAQPKAKKHRYEDSQSWDKWLDGLEFAKFSNQKEVSPNGKKRKKRQTRRQKIRGRR